MALRCKQVGRIDQEDLAILERVEGSFHFLQRSCAAVFQPVLQILRREAFSCGPGSIFVLLISSRTGSSSEK